jgi:hypothetical protein
MNIELTDQDAGILRDLLQQKAVELNKEINRTDSLKFKQELKQLDRTIERIVGVLSAGLERSGSTAT